MSQRQVTTGTEIAWEIGWSLDEAVQVILLWGHAKAEEPGAKKYSTQKIENFNKKCCNFFSQKELFQSRNSDRGVLTPNEIVHVFG